MGAFKRAVKQNLSLRMAITGPAGSGKTYTALRIATAMGLPIAYLDTEHGSASKYADTFEFDVMEMKPPFAPARFVKGIQVAAQEGYKVIIIDSLSHVWNGTGGILEMVEEASARMKGNSYVAWREPTKEHNALIEAIVGSDIHIIATMRSKMDYAQRKDDRGNTTIQKLGMAPIQREGMEYEFDIVMDMDIEHRGVITKTRAPALTDKVFKFPGEDVAKIVKGWLGSDTAAQDIAKAKAKETKPQVIPEEEFPNKPERAAVQPTVQPGPVPQDGKADDVDMTAPPTDYEFSVFDQWQSAADAQEWAVKSGACTNKDHAIKSWFNSVKACNGFNAKNQRQVYLHFLRHQLTKLGQGAVPA